MRRRAFVTAVITISGCLGSGYTGGRSGTEPGSSYSGGGSSGGQIDRTETPDPLPEPVRDDRLRPDPGANEENERVEIAVHEWVNGVRKENGIPQFPWNDELNESARAHSRDMAHHGYFGHEGSGGQVFRPAGCQEWTELLYRKRGVDTPVDLIAHDAVAAWMESEDHREKLTDPSYLRHGVGASKDDEWVYISHSLCE